jgi:hypothetical protein
MTKSEAKAKMVEWIEQKRHETDLLKDLLNQQYILGMLDLAQGLGIINQDERIELLDMAEDGQEDEEEEEEDEDEPEDLEDDDAPLTVEDGPDNYLVRAYSDHQLWTTHFFNTLSEANQYRTDCLCGLCDDVEIYVYNEGQGYRLLFK